MNWLFPGFLAGAFAIALPLALHLLRRWPRQPVVFPSLRFLVPSSRRSESIWQRLCRWLVLLLRCAIFALLAAAFARPFQGGDLARESRAVVVVIDNSFSLQAQGRWESLRQWAQKAAGTFAPGDQFGLLLAAPLPTWLVAPTTNTERAAQALASTSPAWLSVHLEPALRVAGDALLAIPADRRELVVLTDHQRVSWLGTDFAKKLPPGIKIFFPPPPTPVTRQAAVLPPTLTATAGGVRASIAVRNFTDAQKRVLRVYRDGSDTALREETLELAPQQTSRLNLTLPGVGADQAARFRFSLDADDLAADDTAYAVWQPADEGVLLLDAPAVAPSGTNPDFLATALAAAADLKPTLKQVPPPEADWPMRGVAMLRNDSSFTGAAAARLDRFLAAGGAAVVFATGGPAQSAWLDARGIPLTPLPARNESWQVHDWVLEHPLVATLSQRRLEVLLRWEFTAGWSMPVDAVTPLAYWSDDQVAIGTFRAGAGQVLVCGFAPDRRAGDWPILPSFVPFLHQAPTFMFRAQQAVVRAGQVGQSLPLGEGTGDWMALDGPAATGSASVPVTGSVMPMMPGVYQLARGAEKNLFAVNVTPEESDLAIWDAGTPWVGLASIQPAPESKLPRAQLAAVDSEQRAPLWWWVVAGAAILLLAEGLLANRTTR